MINDYIHYEIFKAFYLENEKAAERAWRGTLSCSVRKRARRVKKADIFPNRLNPRNRSGVSAT